jgi:outer membrane protein assembly factor BamB
MILFRYGLPLVIPGSVALGILGGLLGALGIWIWWAFFSRAPAIERWGAIILMIISLLVTSQFIHISIATGGQGMMFVIFSIPILAFMFVIWAVASQYLSPRVRRVSMIATIMIACGAWTLVRNKGITGDFNLDLAWRWEETPEERLLARDSEETIDISPVSGEMVTKAVWPGFRGPNRDGIIKGIRIETDWSAKPPDELWRRPVGPGCSSFAVSGDFLYTQEQRGDDEMITCYHLYTGEPVWRHRDSARFWDSHAGAGPRSTPTINNGRVYTLGATGILNALDAGDGSLIWTREIESDSDTKHSGWGYCSSPLVIDDVVIVAVVGQLAAYDLATGDPRWFGPEGGDGYSSPHLLTIDGITQVVLLSEDGATSLSPYDGTLLWKYSWPGGSRIIQPAMTPDGDLLICDADGTSLRRLKVQYISGVWNFEESWTSSQLKPNFNDFVVNKGHAYGFNGPMLTCIDIKDGRRKWRGGRYGGQLILLADQNLLIVLTEKGEIALVEANPQKFTELVKKQAIEGKTWNHPVLAGDVLLIRNMQEMVAYRLALHDN